MKKGFGLLEVMFAAVVLGFLLVGLNLLQKGNRDAVIRIRTRDAAQIIAQNFIDSLSRLGISSVDTTSGKDTTVFYEWKGNNEKITEKRSYNINYKIEIVDDLKSVDSSDYVKYNPSDVNTVHISAKRVTLTVSWPFKNTPMSIKEERIIK